MLSNDYAAVVNQYGSFAAPEGAFCVPGRLMEGLCTNSMKVKPVLSIQVATKEIETVALQVVNN